MYSASRNMTDCYLSLALTSVMQNLLDMQIFYVWRYFLLAIEKASISEHFQT